MKKQVKTFFKSLDCLYRFRVQFVENTSLVMQFSWTLSVILNNESCIPLSFFWSAFLLIVFVFFFTSFHLSEYTYWFVISVNKGTSQCICSKKFYFPIRTLPLDSSLHNYKKKNAVFAILNLIWTIVKKSWPGLSNCIHLSRKLRKKTFFIARQFLAKLVFFRMGEKKWDKNKTTKSKNYWTVSFSVYWLTNFNDLF